MELNSFSGPAEELGLERPKEMKNLQGGSLGGHVPIPGPGLFEEQGQFERAQKGITDSLDHGTAIGPAALTEE